MSSRAHRLKWWGAGLFLFLLTPLPLLADRRDQKAADLYSDAVRLIKKKEYRQGIGLLQQALDRGATEPNEQQGSQTRFLVYQYDPYYWLGVAFMELNEDEKALLNFDSSETKGVIKKWPEFYSDLVKRKQTLEKRMSIGIATGPTPVPPKPAATATAVVIAIAVPPTQTPVRIVLGETPVPKPPVSAPVTARDLEALKGIQDQVAAWLAAPGLPPDVRSLLSQKQSSLADLSGKGRAGLPREVFQQTATMEASILKDQVLPKMRRWYLELALTELSRRQWGGVETAMKTLRSVDPTSPPQAEIVQFLAAGSRYLLEGKKDPALLEQARQAIKRWRGRAGNDRPLPSIISPALKELIEP